MDLLFIHDHPFLSDSENTVYTTGSFPKEVWHNYLINFKNVKIYARKSTIIKLRNGISSRPGVSFFLTEKYSSPASVIMNKWSIEKELNLLIENADVILVRLPSVLGIIAGELSLRKRKKVWVEQVGNARESLYSHGTSLGKLIAPILNFKNKALVNRANFVSYVTKKKLQIDYPPNKLAITISLSNVIIKQILSKQDFDAKRFYSPSLKIGLIGGFDVKYKGQDILLKAISILDNNIQKKIRLSFVGKGNYDWVLSLAEELGLKDNIDFIGPLESGDQINNFLKTLSLYVQPSLTEGMPRAMIEAMAMGCPVIGSNVGGIPDIVSNNLIHEKGQFSSLSKHISFFEKDREELYKEAVLSLDKAVPYLKSNLDRERMTFYSKMNKIIGTK